MLQHKEQVVFNPENKEHRKAFHKFMERNSWADSPIRFQHIPGYGSVADMVKQQMLKWYMKQEKLKLKI